MTTQSSRGAVPEPQAGFLESAVERLKQDFGGGERWHDLLDAFLAARYNRSTMARILRTLPMGLLCLVATQAGSAQAADSATTKSILTGAYTAAQARSGEALFRRVCAQCHAVAQFNDPNFLRSWSGRTAREMFETIRTQMPQDNPGSLRRDEYAAVIAYIFQLNHLPPGDAPLPADTAALRRIRIELRAPP